MKPVKKGQKEQRVHISTAEGATNTETVTSNSRDSNKIGDVSSWKDVSSIYVDNSSNFTNKVSHSADRLAITWACHQQITYLSSKALQKRQNNCLFFLSFIFYNIHTFIYPSPFAEASLHFLIACLLSGETPPCGAEPRIELGPALQQAGTLPSEPRRTIRTK